MGIYDINRLGIFIFYEENGYVDEYIFYLLHHLKPFFKKLYIVSNVKIHNDAKKRLMRYSDKIYERENKGYDAGALKDFFLKYSNYEELEKYDELIWFNSTFYGPIFPMEDILEKMESQNNDFWGLINSVGRKKYCVPEHICSFFVAVKKDMYSDKRFYEFWKDMEYFKSLDQTMKNYEYRFTQYFQLLGYKYSTLINNKIHPEYFADDMVTYFKYPYEIMRRYCFPIVKCKTISVFCYKQAGKVLHYLEENTSYDVNLIYAHVIRLEKENRVYPYGISALHQFCNKYNKIYIFGHGEFGKELKIYMDDRGYGNKFGGYVVSLANNIGEIELQSLELDNDEGMIIAVGTVTLGRVKENIRSKFSSDKLLFPNR